MKQQSKRGQSIGGRLMAMLAGRCPRCGEGSIFYPLLSLHLLKMRDACPACGLPFLRESGYFLGAMYVSYTLGVITITPVAVALLIVADWSIAAVLAVMFIQTLISMPIFFRYSRTIWLHLDQSIDPR